jgi:probable F420-dependent oxidoreductase
MRVETNLRESDLSQVAEDATEAEALGYDGITASETQHNPFLPLVLAAEHSQHLRLSTAVVIAFPRSPMITAYEAWDLQRYSQGRFVLGLGTQVKGHNERRYGITWSPPGPRLRDYIGALRAIWSAWQNGSALKYEGDHYRLTLMTPAFDPGPNPQAHIPIHIAAINPYLCRLVGEVCDGLHLHSFNTPEYLRSVILPNVQAGLEKSGRSRAQLDIGGSGFLATGRTQEDVERGREIARARIAFYGSTRTYHPVLAAHGWLGLGEDLHELSLRGEWAQMTRRVPDDVVDAFTTNGTYDEIVPRLRARFSGLVDTVSFPVHPNSEAEREQLQSLIAEIKAIPEGARV